MDSDSDPSPAWVSKSFSTLEVRGPVVVARSSAEIKLGTNVVQKEFQMCIENRANTSFHGGKGEIGGKDVPLVSGKNKKLMDHGSHASHTGNEKNGQGMGTSLAQGDNQDQSARDGFFGQPNVDRNSQSTSKSCPNPKPISTHVPMLSGVAEADVRGSKELRSAKYMPKWRKKTRSVSHCH
ncbi:hypothetical protein Ancab_000368 [Ancistrocladus abbreviatus]